MENNNSGLQGQAAIISGGSSELAGAVALALARAGVSVALCGKQADLLELSMARIRAAGGHGLALCSELETPEAAQAVIDASLQAFGRLDILILVAPFYGGGMIHSHNVRTWDLVMSANLREPFLLARAALPHFRAQKGGEVLAIGSDSALGVYPQDGAYGVALHALNTLMEFIKAENSEYGVRTHILSPGLALSDPLDMEGKPTLTTENVSDWVLWLLTRPAHLRANGPILI